MPGDDRSALQTVLDAGSARGRLAGQIAELEAALDEDPEGGQVWEGEVWVRWVGWVWRRGGGRCVESGRNRNWSGGSYRWRG